MGSAVALGFVQTLAHGLSELQILDDLKSRKRKIQILRIITGNEPAGDAQEVPLLVDQRTARTSNRDRSVKLNPFGAQTIIETLCDCAR